MKWITIIRVSTTTLIIEVKTLVWKMRGLERWYDLFERRTKSNGSDTKFLKSFPCTVPLVLWSLYHTSVRSHSYHFRRVWECSLQHVFMCSPTSAWDREPQLVWWEGCRVSRGDFTPTAKLKKNEAKGKSERSQVSEEEKMGIGRKHPVFLSWVGGRQI